MTLQLSTDLPQNNLTDTRVQIYRGSCEALLCHAADDDSGSGFTSFLEFPALEGNTYYIVFDNRWSSNGFSFELTELPYVAPSEFAVGFSSSPMSLPAGNKTCVVDMNGDFLDDIVIVNNNSVTIYYQLSTGGFNAETLPTPPAAHMPSWSLSAGDVNNDGRNDLLYGGGQGVTFMIQNSDGSGFTQQTFPNYVFSQRSNFVDINNDGHLDAFMCHDVAPNVFFMNNGAGILNFNQGGIGDHPNGGNYGSIWVDYDNDGDQDLFIAKCRGGNASASQDELHRNDGNGVFTNVSLEANMYDPSQSWSAAWADFDNDGYMDAMIGASTFTAGGHKLRRNNGDGTFTDVTAGSGWDVFNVNNVEHVAHDFNNDGWVDVFTGGNTIMYNNGDWTFSPAPTNGVNNGPIGDLNADGFLDVQNNNVIFLNNGNSNNWITIHLQGVASNRNGIGARVEIYGSWGKQIRDVRSGDGFRFMSTINAHFGLGQAQEIDQLVVRWPSGTVDVINNPGINEPFSLLEGTHTLSVSEHHIEGLKIYPNPVVDVFSVKTPSSESVAQVRIFDLQGRRVLSTSTMTESVDISALTAGTYIVQLQMKSGRQHVEKIIKN